MELSFDDFFNAKGMAELIKEYANSSNNPLVQDVDLDYINIVREAYKTIIQKTNTTFHVIKENGIVKGLAVLVISSNGNSPKLVCDINSIYVTPQLRKQGYGKKLFQYIDDFSKKNGASGIYFQVPCGSRLERILDKTNYFDRQYSLFYREIV